MPIQEVLKSAGFEKMPFRIVPPNEMDDIRWAGDKAIPDALFDAAQSPRADNLGTSELIVLFGEYGSGKTNALKWLSNKLRADGQLVAYLLKPSVADKPTWHDIAKSLFTKSFHKSGVIERLSKMRKWVLTEADTRARDELGPTAGIDELTAKRDEKINEVAEQVLPESPGFVRFAMDLCDSGKPQTQDRNWNYLAEKPSTSQGTVIATEYGLPAESMSSDYSATLILSNFIRLITLGTPDGVGSDVFYILMDEVEGISDLPPASRLSILQGFRDLFNACTEHLFIALAATLSDASEFWSILDQALMQRLSRQPIELPQMERGTAKDFLLDVMRLYRVQGYTGPPEFPFSEDGLDAFIQSCPPPLTPRKLLVSAQRLAFHDQKDKIAAGQPIDSDDVRQFVAWGGT